MALFNWKPSLTQEYRGINIILCILMTFASLLLYHYATSNNSVIVQIHAETNVIIAVLSARNNFAARSSIRQTWKKLTMEQDSLLYFLIGKNYCTLPIPDRVSSFSCHELFTPHPLETKNISSNILSRSSNKLFYAGFTFLVHSPVIITRLSVISSIAERFYPVTVHLIDSANQNIITSASFSGGENNSTFMSTMIEPYILPHNFEAQIVIETIDQLPPTFNCVRTWNTANGALSFLQLIPHKMEKPIMFNANSCTPVTMEFDIHDPDKFNERLTSRDSRQRIYDAETNLTQRKLLEETKEMNDIVLLDVVDVYKNLPKKLLLFLKWISREKKFNYLIKSDDDTFLNIIEIKKELSKITRDSPPLWWWGLFRHQWAVGTSGKWREDLYRSLTYPPFPCGSAYVLSYDVVQYLAGNARLLETGFQGEDVSIGIWLAGLSTVRHHSERVSCDETCSSNSLNRAQLSVQEMYETWEMYNRCGELCNCTLD